MAIPGVFSVMLPYLKIIANKPQCHMPEIVQDISKHFRLTQSEQQKLLASGDGTILAYRVRWAKAQRRFTMQIHDYGDACLVTGLQVGGRPVPVYIDKSICPPVDGVSPVEEWFKEQVQWTLAGGGDKGQKHGTNWPNRSRWVWMYRELNPDGSVSISAANGNS